MGKKDRLHLLTVHIRLHQRHVARAYGIMDFIKAASPAARGGRSSNKTSPRPTVCGAP